MSDEQILPPAEGVKQPQAGSGFTVAGHVKAEQAEELPRDLQLKAYVFDSGGRFLGAADVDAQGSFNTGIRLAQPAPIEIVIGPAGDPQTVRRSSAPRQRYGVKDWAGERGKLLLKAAIALRPDVLEHFWPLSICVSGHVRQVFNRGGETALCPVPFAKVEVFDVDREPCWWPYLVKYLDRIEDPRILRVPDLLKGTASGRAAKAANAAMQGPRLDLADAAPAALDARVGEMKSLAEGVASRLENLTLTSTIAPWVYFPSCFYSRVRVCETRTDCDGYFNCCFPWWIFHVRRGRMRFDLRPDIILRITQVINGVKTVIYMDPYTSTRWNVTKTHIDLFLDDEAIVCGGCASDPLPGTSVASVLQIGSDPVWLADQADGRFKTPRYSNGAWGGSLYLRGNFSADLLTGSPRRYYKLSWARAGSTSFTPIQTALSALRSAPGGTFETYLLGPQPAGPVAGLYEVQDTAHWWLVPGAPGGSGMVLGLWGTSFEPDQGAYTLRLEVYDDAGNKITTLQFANHGGNGSGVDPDPVPTVTDHLDLKFHLDNKPVAFHLTTPATNACGVIPWSEELHIGVGVHAEQENGRVHSWNLCYVKGVNSNCIPLAKPVGHPDEYVAGQSPVDATVSADALLKEPVTPANPLGQLQSTCAFALILRAWSHVRDNWGDFPKVGEKVYAVVVEKCSS